MSQPSSAQSFAHRQTRAPRPFDPDRGAEALALFPDAKGPLADLIRGAGACSPYLCALMAREADWLMPALDTPEAARDAVLAALPELAPDAISGGLRQAKRRLALLAGLADLGGVWSLEEVTGTLTQLADAALDAGLKQLVRAEIARGKLPGLTEDDIATAGGMVVLAMGKMGAHELNYSSDIDLICLFDETRLDIDTFQEVRAGFIRITRKLMSLIADITAEGYVFRTDLRLRPDPSTTPVCLSFDSAERYYESLGRTWERAAYIKARPAAGDLAAGAKFLDTMRPFVWRKHLDFAAIEDAHDMRLRIRNHKGLHGPLVLEGHNMKLGRGGIREIEFFTQTRQLIAGGRDRSLRLRETGKSLSALAAANWVPQDVADTLLTHYRAHREVEHRLQMVQDAQTHHLPNTARGFERIAAFVDMDAASLRRDLTARIEEVHALTEDFFAPGTPCAAPGDFGADVTQRWLTYPALRSERAAAIFRRLRPEILRRLSEAAKPDEALAQFDGFLAGLPAGVQLFSLFEANPQLTQLIVDIAATAPALARYLSRNAGVFDAVIAGDFFAPWPGVDGLLPQLAAALAQVDGDEARLDTARRWMKERHFRIGVHHLRGLIGADEAGRAYADLAETVLRGIWPHVTATFAAKHGKMPGQGAVVLGMGSLGVARLNAGSDLDLIMIYDADGIETSDGPRPLATRAYYARLTQSLLTALTAPMAEGKLYEVDMRLRPSGRQGPVATSFPAFRDYQRNEAWTWEHLALTRARPLAGDEALARKVEAFRQELLAEKAEGDTILKDVGDMRARIAAAKAAQGDWDAKLGRGRLQDVELIAQTAALRAGSPARQVADQLAAGAACGWLTAQDNDTLCTAAALFWRLQAAARLLTGETLVPEALGEGGRRFVLRETGYETIDALQEAMAKAADAADAVITRHLEHPSQEAAE